MTFRPDNQTVFLTFLRLDTEYLRQSEVMAA